MNIELVASANQPSYKNVLFWQASALASAFWLMNHPHKTPRAPRWESLPPKLPVSTTPSGVYDPKSKSFDTRAAALPKDQGPLYFEIDVPALPECGIPAHWVSLTFSDYQAALASLSAPQRRAWNEYLGKARASAIFALNRTPRRRVEPSKEKARALVEAGRYELLSMNDKGFMLKRVDHYVSRNNSADEILEMAARKITAMANRPSMERLAEMMTEQLRQAA